MSQVKRLEQELDAMETLLEGLRSDTHEIAVQREMLSKLTDGLASWQPEIPKLQKKAEEPDPDKRTLGPKASANVLALCARFLALSESTAALAQQLSPEFERLEKERQLVEEQRRLELMAQEAEAQRQRKREEEAMALRAAAEAEELARIAAEAEEKRRKLDEWRRQKQKNGPTAQLGSEDAEEEPVSRWQAEPVSAGEELSIELALKLAEESDLRRKEISDSLDSLKQESASEFRSVCQTLLVLVRNVQKEPLGRPCRTINCSNELFHRDVGQYPAAVAVLKTIGFEEEVHEGKPMLVLNRLVLDDLSLARSVIESKH